MFRIKYLVPCLLLLSLVSIIFSGCSSGAEQTITFSQLISQANKYNGKVISFEAFYFSGFEISALSESVGPSTSGVWRIVPTGTLIWVEGGIPKEVYDKLYAQTVVPSGYTERIGKLKVTGKFETGGKYGHLDGYDYQIAITSVELLEWTPPPAATTTPSIGNLQIKVSGLTGKPLPGAKVVSEEQPEGQLKVTGLTDDNGIVIFNDIKSGEYKFFISHADYSPTETTVIVTGGETAAANVSLDSVGSTPTPPPTTPVPSSGNLSIRIQNAGGKTLQGAEVISINQPEGQTKISGLTDAGGIITFNDINSGEYKFSISRTDYSQAKIAVTVQGEQTSNFALAMALVGQAPDDVMPALGMGPQYRANLIGVSRDGSHINNPWPPIQSTEVALGKSPATVQIIYRDYIETQAGQTRNNIFFIYQPDNRLPSLGDMPFDVTLKTTYLPAGITVTTGWQWRGPATQRKVGLKIEIAPQVGVGKHIFSIDVQINGEDFGSLPCTINVVPSPSSGATSSSGSWTTFTTDDGLSDNVVRSIIQDNQGILWFGTDLGNLMRFNGSHWENYSGFPGKSAIICAARDKQGNLWFGTTGEGAFVYNGKEWQNFNPGKQVGRILADNQGNIWFATTGNAGLRTGPISQGVTRYNGTSWTTFLDGTNVNAIFQDRQGNLWFGQRGALRFDGTHWQTFTTEDGLADNFVIAICQDNQDNMWFGTWNDGVSRYDGKGWQTFYAEDGLETNAVHCMLKDSRGNLWFGSYSIDGYYGISRFDGTRWQHFDPWPGRGDKYHYNVTSIFEDNEGNIWFATMLGLVRYNPD